MLYFMGQLQIYINLTTSARPKTTEVHTLSRQRKTMIHLDGQGFIAQRRLEDQRLLEVQPQLYHRAQLGIGPKPPMQDAPVFTDTWDFPDEESALKALSTWNPEETSEPQGWHRHPGTGRYRIDGDA